MADNVTVKWLVGCETLCKSLFHLIFKQRLFDIFKQNWFESVPQSSILTTYVAFKSIEKYLEILPRQFRIYISKTRLSSHSLKTETGRFGPSRTERSQRHCEICKENDIEDEYHFILKCKKYYHQRPIYQEIHVFLFKTKYAKIHLSSPIK